MSKSKFQKKKEREKEVRKKILSRREAHRSQERENSKFDAEEKAVRSKPRPIRNEEFYAAQRLRDMEIRMQLEHNMKLLEGLQKEYEDELKKREAYLQELEKKEQSEIANDLVEGMPTEVDIFDDPQCGNGLKPAESLVEKASDRLQKVYEKWQTNKGKKK